MYKECKFWAPPLTSWIRNQQHGETQHSVLNKYISHLKDFKTQTAWHQQYLCLGFLPQVKNLENGSNAKMKQCQVLQPKGTDLQWLKLVSHLHHLKLSPAPINSIVNTTVSTYLMLPSSTALGLTQQKPKFSQYLQGPMWPWHSALILPPTPPDSPLVRLCSIPTSHSAPATAASLLLLKHGIKSLTWDTCA